jgi:hypothetical protein
MKSPQHDDDGECAAASFLSREQTERASCRRVNSHSTLLSPYFKAIAIVRDTRVLPFQDIECFHQARLVRITHGRLAVWLDPLGMLDPQVVVNLFPQVCVRIKLMKHDH